jgi:hypothetical protein
MKNLALIAFLLSNPAVAGPATGNDIYAACTATPGGVEQGFCIGYIIGVFEGVRLGGFTMLVASGAEGTTQELDAATSNLQMLCMPIEVENGQVIAVAQQYLENNPQSRHEPARSLIFFALREAFPCKE